MIQKRWICLALVLLTLVCFGHVCVSEFINLDDPLYITDNPHVLGGLTWANVRWAFTDSCFRAGYWVPLTWLSLQTDATLFGPEGSGGFHLTNLLLHTAVVMLFFLVLARMTGDVYRSAAAAALFAIHPLRVESVAWVTERKDMVSTLFLLLTVGAYYRYTEKPTWGSYGVVCLSFFLGLMAKPTLVTLPFALLLLDYWPLDRLRLGQKMPASHASRPGVEWQRLVLEKLPLLATALAISYMTMHFASQVGAVHSHPLSQRVMVALSGYLGYLENTLWPTNLAVLYPWRVPSEPRVTLAVVILGAITAGLVWLGRQQPALIVGWFWFLGTLFPVSGVVQVGPQALADRYSYVPHLGLVIVIVWGISGLPAWQQSSDRIRKIILGMALLALGTLTWIQVWYWYNGETLFTHALSITEKNYEMEHSLSGFWFKRADRALREGNTDQAADYLALAEKHIARAVELAPNNFKCRFYYGGVLVYREKYDEAVAQFEKCLELAPEQADAYWYMGETLVRMKRWDEAERYLQKSVELWAANPKGDITFGDIPTRKASPHYWLGEIALHQGDPVKAFNHLNRALAIKRDLDTHQLAERIKLYERTHEKDKKS